MIERRMAKEAGEFRRAYEKGFGRLKIPLRRQQIETAKKGNVSMLIWLGKQLLDQSDKSGAFVGDPFFPRLHLGQPVLMAPARALF